MLRCLPMSQLLTVATTSSRLMEEQHLTTQVLESAHPLTDTRNDHLSIPGSSYLAISFDPRSNVEGGELVFAMSSDLKTERKTFSGKGPWMGFNLPGDSLYMRVKVPASTGGWGYKIWITGGHLERFETGYIVLEQILQLPQVMDSLDVSPVWSSLVLVACRQTGHLRLQALHLMLQLLFSPQRQQQLDLNLLRPLWLLYCQLTPVKSKAPTPLIRALSELFLVAEDLAMVSGSSLQSSVCWSSLE